MKLHLGCGNKRLPGYINVDIRLDVEPDIVADVRDMGSIESNTADEIYFCHGIEHIPYNDIPPTFLEWRRVLIPGGILRLSVPDFRIVVDLYHDRGLDPQIRAILCGGQEYHHNIHYSIWDEQLLTEMLEKTGYSSVRRYHSTMKDYSILKVGGIPISINVEAIA